jgi:hypothetical protein
VSAGTLAYLDAGQIRPYVHICCGLDDSKWDKSILHPASPKQQDSSVFYFSNTKLLNPASLKQQK